MKNIQSRTIVFITGAFVHHSCWDNWRAFFENEGYTTIAPPWLHKDADAITLRTRHPDTALAAVTLPNLVEQYANIIHGLPEEPILIGHSFGGLLAQILLNNGLGAAAVAIHAVPPKGVIPYELNFFKSNLEALGLFTTANKTYLMSFEKWQFVFTNGLPFDIQKGAYYDYAIPESKRVLRGGLSGAAKIDFKKAHPPLLFLAGTQDHCIPAHLCKRVFKKYTNKNSITAFVEKDRNHFVLGLPTWKEDALFIHRWLQS